jgi:hypothetical protein
MGAVAVRTIDGGESPQSVGAGRVRRRLALPAPHEFQFSSRLGRHQAAFAAKLSTRGHRVSESAGDGEIR